MIAQLDQFIGRQSSVAVNAQTLFVVEAGGAYFNNFSAGLPLIQAGTITSTQFVTAAVTDVANVLLRLSAAGARHILLISAPNFGGTPGVQALGTAAATAGTQLSFAFNQALAGQVAGLVAASPGLKVYTLDAFALFNEVQGNPAGFGLTNATAPCVTTTSVCTTPDAYMFWDTVHPTRAMGAIVATRAATLLPSP
jgi:phospholipase/lecithinase/hemolysin